MKNNNVTFEKIYTVVEDDDYGLPCVAIAIVLRVNGLRDHFSIWRVSRLFGREIAEEAARAVFKMMPEEVLSQVRDMSAVQAVEFYEDYLTEILQKQRISRILERAGKRLYVGDLLALAHVNLDMFTREEENRIRSIFTLVRAYVEEKGDCADSGLLYKKIEDREYVGFKYAGHEFWTSYWGETPDYCFQCHAFNVWAEVNGKPVRRMVF